MAAKEDFFEALYQGDVPTAERVWRDNGLSANVKDSVTGGLFGTHALGYAVRLRAHAFAEELIAHGADVDARGEDGVSAMWMANDRAGVEILRRHGANANLPLTRGGDQFSKGAVALHRAAAAGNADLVTALIEAGADALAVDEDGVSPLHYAAKTSESAVRALIDAGADLDATDKYGNTARKSLEETFPAFQQGVGATHDVPVAAMPKDVLAGYRYVDGKELSADAGDYFITVAADNSMRVGFVPAMGSLDGAIEFETAAQLDEHLAGVTDKDRAAVSAFVQRSRERLQTIEAMRDGIEATSSGQPSVPPVEVEANTIQGIAKPDARTQLADRLSRVDWYCGYSDDSAVRMAGAAQMQEALKDLEAFAQKDKAAAIELWEQHGVKHISPPSFLRDAQASEQAAEVAPIVPNAAENSVTKDEDVRTVPDEALENTISAAPGRNPHNSSPAQENAFLRAPRPAQLSATGSPDKAGQPVAASKEGPATLLNGRFIRRENGEYFRVADGKESKRIALVDEDEKIRFVDKQMDAFQAAIELAKHKDWEAILVTGTEKFRSEAWYHARMAGLEVVGYEPTEKDLETLAAAQTNAPAQSVHTAAVGSDKAIAESKEAALKHALGAGSVVMETKEQNGLYTGKVIHQTEHHVVQDLGKKSAVIHEKSRFDASALKKSVEHGESVRIQYAKGRAGVEAKQDRSRSQGVSR